MAALPPPHLAVPAPIPPALYRDYFNDPAHDVFLGEYTEVLAPYAPGHHTPEVVRTLACNSRSQQVPTAFILMHTTDLKLHVYVQLDKFNPRMGLPATEWDDRMFIGKGELFNNNQVLVEWDSDYFRQGNNTRVLTATEISNQYAADPNANILGPYTNADADTANVVCRRTCFVPPPYVGLFLGGPLTPREAWDVVYTQIVNDNKEAMCAPFIDYLRCCLTTSTLNQPPAIAQAPPTAPLADHLLLGRHRQHLELDFPLLGANVAQIQQHQIANQLGQLVAEARANRNADAAARAVKVAGKTPTQFLGAVGVVKLLRYCNLANAAGLPTFWMSVSASPKKQQLSILQWEIDRIKLLVNEPDLEFTATGPLLEAILKLNWAMETNDSVTTGLNLFLLHAGLSQEESLGLQQVWEMLHSNGAAPSMSDAERLMTVKAGAPVVLHEARHQLRRYEIILKAVIGENHPLSLMLHTCCNRMLSMESFLHRQQLHAQYLPVKILKRIAVLCSVWFRNQVSSPNLVTIPILDKLFDDMLEENYWEPTLSSTFLYAVGLSAPVPSFPTSSPRPAPASNPQVANPPVARTDDRANNTTFNATLFSSYKNCTTQCRSLRLKIQRNELRALPLSKIDNLAMCLAWHAKGLCNTNCSRSADHVAYTATEYEPFLAWCQECFITE